MALQMLAVVVCTVQVELFGRHKDGPCCEPHGSRPFSACQVVLEFLFYKLICIFVCLFTCLNSEMKEITGIENQKGNLNQDF